VTKGKVAYYYPFGMQMPGRSITSPDGYRYGFNGMERDDEVKGNGNQYSTHYRQYDPRLGRWTSLDPKKSKYPFMSPYSGMGNNPMKIIDENGDTLRVVGDLSFIWNTNMYIAKLRSTTKGEIMYQLINNSPVVYSIVEATSALNSSYNGNSTNYIGFMGIYKPNTLYYDDQPGLSALFAQMMVDVPFNGYTIFAHEFHHMFSDEASRHTRQSFGFYKGVEFGGFFMGEQSNEDLAEKTAIKFGNYIRLTEGIDNWKRTRHGSIGSDTDFTNEWKNKGEAFFNPDSDISTFKMSEINIGMFDQEHEVVYD
jgi:RHS repeat-associated protein